MNQLGKYAIHGIIGKGGMGMVYRASDPFIGRDVAIKVIPETTLDVPKIRELFYREAKSAGRLSHENIMTIYDVGEEEGKPYIVMEYLEGDDLRTVITENKFTSLQQKLEISIQICKGLEYAHQNDVIHRDIKPENIRLMKNDRVKIMDFGIARLDSETRTLTQGSIGTPRYMSPEQIKGKDIDHRTDIFSFGVVLYEVLTGNNPFLGEHVTTVIYKILHEEPEPIQIENGDLTTDLQRVVSKCLEKEPDQRYPDFSTLIRDLNEILSKHWGPATNFPNTLSPDNRLKDNASHPVSSEETVLYTPAPKKERPDAKMEERAVLFKRISIAVVSALGLVLVGFGIVKIVANADEGKDPAEIVTTQSIDTSPGVDSVDDGRIPEASQNVMPGDGEEIAEPEPDRNENAGAPQQVDEPPVTSGPSETETENIRLAAAADQARRRMLTQKNLAENVGAANNALSSFQQALRREQNGTIALRRQDYRVAQTAFSDAEGLFRTAARLAEQRSEADEARQSMSRIRQQVSSQRGRTELASLFQQAEARSTDATRQYNAEEFDEAVRSFQNATDVYTQIQRRIEQAERQPEETTPPASSGNQAQATTARGAMLTSKSAIRGDLRNHASYQEAVNLENEGNSAFESRAFDDAARYFSQAEQLYREVAALPGPEVLAEQGLSRAVSRLKSFLEGEDAAGLHALSSYYARDLWTAFFRSVEGVTATIETGELEVEGNTASVTVQVNLRFLNTTVNQRQEQNFDYVWTLQRSEGDEWTLQRITERR